MEFIVRRLDTGSEQDMEDLLNKEAKNGYVPWNIAVLTNNRLLIVLGKSDN